MTASFLDAYSRRHQQLIIRYLKRPFAQALIDDLVALGKSPAKAQEITITVFDKSMSLPIEIKTALARPASKSRSVIESAAAAIVICTPDEALSAEKDSLHVGLVESVIGAARCRQSIPSEVRQALTEHFVDDTNGIGERSKRAAERLFWRRLGLVSYSGLGTPNLWNRIR